MINNIQLLRAFAAISVVFLHVLGATKLYGYPVEFLYLFDGWGVFGVDLFFVISGFVMTYTQFYNPKKPLEFIRNRCLRIAPLYWSLTLALSFMLVWKPSLFTNIKFSLEWLINSLLFSSQLIYGQSPILRVGWTLEYEMFFYAIFTLSLLVSNFRTSLLLLAFSIIGIVFIFKNLIFLEFLLGVFIFYVHLKFSKQYDLRSAFFVGAILLIISTPVNHYFQINRFFLFGIPSALLLLGAVNLKQTQNKYFIELGNSSYSIYLIQIFTIPAFYKLIKLFNIYYLTNLAIAALCLLSTIVLGVLLYFSFELRMTNFLKTIMRVNFRSYRVGGS